MPPRGSVREAKEFAQKHGGWIAARLRRLPEAAPFADGTVLPLRGVQHRIVHRPGVRGTVWAETGADGEALLCVAGAGAAHRPPGRRFSAPRGAARSRSREPPRRRAARRRDQAHLGARPVEPLGLVLDHRRAVVLVAADPRAALRAGLSRRARGGASDRDEPLGAVLAAGERRLLRTPTAPSSGSTSTAPICTATVACRGPELQRPATPALKATMLAPGSFALTLLLAMLTGTRPAVGRHVSGVAAVDRPPARRADVAGAADDLGLSDRLRRRPGVLRPAVGPPRPPAGAARRARHLSCWRRWPARCRFPSRR